MIATMGSSVWAEDVETNTYTSTSGETSLKYEVTQSYEWTVPKEIVFDADTAEKTSEIKVTKNVIAENSKLQITAEGKDTTGNAFYITNGKTNLNYEIKSGDSKIDPKGVVLEVPSGTNTKDASLTFVLTKTATGNTAEVPGSYKGNVTYTASVVSTTNASTVE